MNKQQLKFVFSGGGTGGHIFPAIAVATELKKTFPNAEFLFFGALGKMEMEQIPKAGFQIIGIPVQGLKRKITFSNFKVFFNLIKSYFIARKKIKQFKPNVVIGTGGYVSLPVIFAAQKLKINTVIWEGNGYAGLANNLLAKRAKVICTGLPNMEKFFPKNLISFTGNPVRTELLKEINKQEAYKILNLNPNKKTIFITGGSLGAGNINKAIFQNIDLFYTNQIQLIWQTGKSFTTKINQKYGLISTFITNMEMAYAAADIVISRAGAITISEICCLTKPAILVPSPNVTDDHQTKNAMALVTQNAAILHLDSQWETLANTAFELLNNASKQKELKQNLTQFAKPNSTQNIVKKIIELI